VYVFYDYFCVICTGRRTFNSFRSGVKKFNYSIKDTTIFPPVSEAVNTLWLVCENWVNEGDGDAPSKVSLQLPIGETFSREATALVALKMPR